MKFPILLTLATLCAASSLVSAQTVTGKTDEVQLENIPDLSQLFRAPITPVETDKQSLFGSDMPPRPKLDSASPTGTKLSVLPTARGDVLQVEAVRQRRADILKKITDVMGVRAVIDPQLEKKWTITEVFRGLSWDELLNAINYEVEMVKSPAGTYFFAEKSPSPTQKRAVHRFRILPDGRWERIEDAPAADLESHEKLRSDPRYDPFVIPYGGLNPGYLKGWGVEPTPQPGWEKREFNGHEFYYIPAPKVAPVEPQVESK